MPELQEVWDKTTVKFLGNQYPPRADGGDPRMPVIPEDTKLTGDLKYPAWDRWGPPPPPRAQGTDGDEASRGWEAPSDNTRKRASEFGLRMSHGWTVSDGTFEPIPQDKRRKRDVPYPTYVSYSYRSRSALSSLQLSRDAPISMTALDITLDHLWKCMPGEASRYLHINLPNGPALWGDNEAAKTAMYAKMSEKKYHLPISGKPDETEYRLYSDLKKRPWIIWPLWVEDKWGSDYVTVIWHSQNTIDNVDLFDQLVSYAIIDPRRSPDPDGNQRHQPIEDRHVRLQARLAELWSRAGIDIKNVQELDVRCSPMPFDEATSGERCFAVVKGLINQIIDWFTSGMEYYNDSTITSMSQWVNPYQQRIEMTGICAWVLMATLDYNARISVEAILPNTRWDVAADGKKKYLYPYDLAGPFEEPPIASYDYLLPSNKMYSWYSTEATTEK
ncbi:hypothetical protein F4825DRAFT_35960 [Nemania diffusa]|nr:hypothetical protein F4825DRAFT_35960 [Nemania diffusa]